MKILFNVLFILVLSFGYGFANADNHDDAAASMQPMTSEPAVTDDMPANNDDMASPPPRTTAHDHDLVKIELHDKDGKIMDAYVHRGELEANHDKASDLEVGEINELWFHLQTLPTKHGAY